MTQQNTFSTLNGLFKEIYSDGLENLIPDGVKLLKMIPFSQQDKEIGNYYHQPVVLGPELGMTFGSATAGAFSLNNSIGATMADAQIRGTQMLLRGQMAYEAAARASNGGKKAFVKATELLVKNLVNSRSKFTEIEMFYGSSPSGLASISGAASVTSASTRCVITIPVGQWSSGVWAGMAGVQLDVYDGTTQETSNAALAVTAVDVNNRILHCTGNATDITAIDAAAATANIQIYFRGAYGNEMSGIDKLITNTGTLHNISATTYDLWAGNTYSCGAADISLAKILKGLATPVGKGLEEDVTVFLSPLTWSKLATDFAALRRYDSSYSTKKLENGTEALTIYGLNGMISIIPSIYVKQMDGFVVSTNRIKRIGSTDWTFNLPGRNDEFFLHIPDYASFELRTYSDQNLFCEAPGRTLKLIDITNS